MRCFCFEFVSLWKSKINIYPGNPGWTVVMVNNNQYRRMVVDVIFRSVNGKN